MDSHYFVSRLLPKIGPLKNQILVYGVIAAVFLMVFGRKIDPPLGTILTLGSMTMLLGTPIIWLIAYSKKGPANIHEQVFQQNTIVIVDEHKVIVLQSKLQVGEIHQC